MYIFRQLCRLKEAISASKSDHVARAKHESTVTGLKSSVEKLIKEADTEMASRQTAKKRMNAIPPLPSGPTKFGEPSATGTPQRQVRRTGRRDEIEPVEMVRPEASSIPQPSSVKGAGSSRNITSRKKGDQ